MLSKDELIQIINQLITPPAETWQNDPFEVLVKQCPKEIFDKYIDSPIEDAVPSTSEDVRTVNADARIRFSQIIGGLYLELAARLDSMRAPDTDEYKLVSLQDVSIIKKSFEFFLLTGILPFLEPGVGLPASSRSTFIKSWKLYDGNKEACIERLDFASEVIVNLLKSNDAILVQFLPKFIYDMLAVRYQLLELRVEKYEPQMEEIFSKCPTDMLFGALMFLTQDRKPSVTPRWLKIACGTKMTSILVGEDGLSHLMKYYLERAGDTWTENLPMTRQVAWHLATVPKMFQHPLKYHEIISNQFFSLFYKEKVPDRNLLNVFVSYVDQLRVRFSLNADLTVYDKILNFWEILDKDIKDRTNVSQKVEIFHPNHIKNLQLLTELQSSMQSKRIRALVNVFLACAESVPYAKDILKFVMDNVGSLGVTIYQFVMVPFRTIELKKKTTSMIQEIGQNANGNESTLDELWLNGFENQDEGVSARLETAFYVVDNVLCSAQIRTMLEMMSAALDDFLKVSEKEREDDSARFVQLEGAKFLSSFHAHLLIGCCFERLCTISGDSGFSSEECHTLLRLSENILNNATSKYMRLINRKRNLDVFKLSETEQKELQCTQQTVRMTIPLISTLIFITQGQHRLQDLQLKAIEAMANFIKVSEAFPTDDLAFNAVLEETRVMLKNYKIDVNQLSPPIIPQRTEQRRRYTQMDICTEWIDELHEDEPAVKGGALMQISKAFRNKTWHCQKLLDYGAFETVKEMLAEEDSYVYLSAINCLCEMSTYNYEISDSVIEYYEELSEREPKDEQLTIRIGRLAEAIGKLMLARGEYSISYFDRLATVFMKGINEQDEILRASCCGAFGNLIQATKGRGVQKWMDRLLRALLNVIRADRKPLVRRAAVDLIRYSLRGAGRDMFTILREHLLDLYREVRTLHTTDRDDTVRLHAQLCLEEINAALNENQEDTERGYHRRIRF
ncbi:CBN-EKL-6 protein [Caenorhabditis brenneri]|uniref:CBN-EKL-6 protein n=1 Tax=Caenorhabditis brenneri TaxID=135651 RepID=G0MKH5_CAEBE|nr:CBN-EKL-6 protein [Caenorhabditis brenneri]